MEQCSRIQILGTITWTNKRVREIKLLIYVFNDLIVWLRKLIKHWILSKIIFLKFTYFHMFLNIWKFRFLRFLIDNKTQSIKIWVVKNYETLMKIEYI